jgi:hypothetical protein
MREKSLPPLPDEINLHPPTDQLDSQPRTMYPHDHRQIPAGASPPVQDFFAPRAPFHAEEARRQSFGGITTRPNFTAQTLPSKGLYVQEFSPPANKYNEFGTSRRSLGYLDHIEEKQPILTTPSKRKSKFGLTAFLGRKSQTYDRNLLVSHDSSTSRRSTSDVRDNITSNGGYGTSASRHSVGPRMSVMSRKAVEELVEQVRDFVQLPTFWLTPYKNLLGPNVRCLQVSIGRPTDRFFVMTSSSLRSIYLIVASSIVLFLLLSHPHLLHYICWQ